jgi:hypothetical protein
MGVDARFANGRRHGRSYLEYEARIVSPQNHHTRPSDYRFFQELI